MTRAGVATLEDGADQAPPRGGQTRKPGSRTCARRRSPAYRHRPHALGHPRRADHRQRPPARHRQSRHRPQRHHRELPRAARRADQGRPQVRVRNRHRSHRPPDRRLSRARANRPNKPPSPPSAASTAPSASPCCSRARTTFSSAPAKARRWLSASATAKCSWAPTRIAVSPVHHARDLSRGRRHRRPLTHQGQSVRRRRPSRASAPVHMFAGGAAAVEKGNYRHFMQKEIYEQPETTGRTITRYVDANDEARADAGPRRRRSRRRQRHRHRLRHRVLCRPRRRILVRADRRHRVETDIATEFRYRKPAFGKKRVLPSSSSQSGETADTLAALRYCKEQGREDARRRQRAEIHHLARSRCAPADARRPGNRRRLDQGVHRAALCARRARHRRRPRARRALAHKKKAASSTR